MKTISIALFFCAFLTPALTQAWFGQPTKEQKDSITIKIDGKKYESKFRLKYKCPDKGEPSCERIHCIFYQGHFIPVDEVLLCQKLQKNDKEKLHRKKILEAKQHLQQEPWRLWGLRYLSPKEKSEKMCHYREDIRIITHQGQSISTDKVLPKQENINTLQRLQQEPWGFCGLWRLQQEPWDLSPKEKSEKMCHYRKAYYKALARLATHLDDLEFNAKAEKEFKKPLREKIY